MVIVGGSNNLGNWIKLNLNRIPINASLITSISVVSFFTCKNEIKYSWHLLSGNKKLNIYYGNLWLDNAGNRQEL